MRAECPMLLLTCLMRTRPVVSSDFGVVFGPFVFHHTCVLAKLRLPYLRSRAITERSRLDTALARDFFNGGQLLQSIECSEHHVMRIRRAQALRKNVGNACTFHDRA